MIGHAQLQRNAFSDRCHPGLHLLVCGVLAELPASRGMMKNAVSWSTIRHQPVADPFPASDRKALPQVQMQAGADFGPKLRLSQGKSWSSVAVHGDAPI
jgi:hypothetical protein